MSNLIKEHAMRKVLPTILPVKSTITKSGFLSLKFNYFMENRVGKMRKTSDNGEHISGLCEAFEQLYLCSVCTYTYIPMMMMMLMLKLPQSACHYVDDDDHLSIIWLHPVLTNV